MKLPPAPARKTYLHQQRQKHGRHIFGVLPAYYPREILWAFEVLPVEIWDPPVDTNLVQEHLPPYVCQIVKGALSLILQESTDLLEGLLFPHTCDALQNLASLMHDGLAMETPCYFFYHPKACGSSRSRRYYIEQLKHLVTHMEKRFGPLKIKDLKRAVEQGQQIAALISQLYHQRAQRQCALSNQAFYELIRRGEYLHPDDFIPMLQQVLEQSPVERKGPVVVLDGVLPGPPELLTLLDELGIIIGEDNLLNCGRRLLVPPVSATDPILIMAQSYFEMPPCSTKAAMIPETLEHLLHKITVSKAQAVIFNTLRFCEPELWALPQLEKAMQQQGLLTLSIHFPEQGGPSDQLREQVQAFAATLQTR